MKTRIRVKHIMELLQNEDPEAPINFYHFDKSFEESDLGDLEWNGGKDKDDVLNVFVR